MGGWGGGQVPVHNDLIDALGVVAHGVVCRFQLISPCLVLGNQVCNLDLTKQNIFQLLAAPSLLAKEGCFSPAMAPYKILKQGYMLKEPPVSKRGIRKVRRGGREAGGWCRHC